MSCVRLHAALVISLAIWACDWMPIASAAMFHASAPTCGCANTQGCCCKRPNSAAGQSCHLPNAAPAPDPAGCRLEPVGCHDGPPLVWQAAQRDMTVLAAAEPIGDSAPVYAPARSRDPAASRAFLDPLFVPPELLLASA
jgi:hypothetical protein